MDREQALLELIAATSAGDEEKDRRFRARASQIISRAQKVLDPALSNFPNSDFEQHKARLLEMNLSPVTSECNGFRCLHARGDEPRG